jgi:hypothetical protein
MVVLLLDGPDTHFAWGLFFGLAVWVPQLLWAGLVLFLLKGAYGTPRFGDVRVFALYFLRTFALVVIFCAMYPQKRSGEGVLGWYWLAFSPSVGTLAAMGLLQWYLHDKRARRHGGGSR